MASTEVTTISCRAQPVANPLLSAVAVFLTRAVMVGFTQSFLEKPFYLALVPQVCITNQVLTQS